jgi:hypothetical protein
MRFSNLLEVHQVAKKSIGLSMSNGKGIAKIHPPIEDKWSSFGCDAKLINLFANFKP